MDILGRLFLSIAAALCLLALMVLFLLGGALLVIATGLTVHGLLRMAERSDDGARALARKETEDALFTAFRR